MSHNGLTGLTAQRVNGPRTGAKPSTPVRPVRRRKMTGSDGSAVCIGPARAPTERKAAKPSDPSGAGTTAIVVREATAQVFHLASSRRIRIGYILCAPGELLCGSPVALQPSLGELFPPEVTCYLCAAIAARDRISAGGDAA